MTIPAISEMALQSLLDLLADVDSYVFLESTKVTPENHQSLLFVEPLERLIFRLDDDPARFFQQAQNRLGQGFFLAGYISYEFGYLLEPSLENSLKMRPIAPHFFDTMELADLGVYRQPHIYDHQTASFSGAGPWPTGKARESTPTLQEITNLRLNQEKDDYLKVINRIKSYIAAGDTYQVNYTLKLLFDYTGSTGDLYSTLRRNQSVSYGGIIKNGANTILTFSPELFFRKQGETITVRPMKGTMHRGRTLIEDRDNVEFLHNDIKNRSENVMIVDLLRNDLGRLSRMGGVSVQSLFDVETYETLHQMTSSIKGEVGNVSLEEMFRALFPCGSVTGAPKIRTMEIIRQLEVDDRGVYTGAIGYITPTGDAMFNVPIRTVVLREGQGEMGIGSGIVWDSDPVNEWEECNLKANFLTRPPPEFKLIETMLWHPKNGYWQLDLHLKRLADSAQYFAYPFDQQKISGALTELAASFKDNSPQQCQRVRMTLDRNGDIELTHAVFAYGGGLEIDLEEILDRPTNNILPQVVLSDKKTDSRSPYLCHKTTMRELYDDERKRLTEAGFYEVLFTNEAGEVTEGAVNNIFIKKGKYLITPPLSSGLLPGVLREYLLATFPERIIEAHITRNELKQAEALFVGNSVRGLVQVKLEKDRLKAKD
jgi:para-aminobenzoate synthetase/4-amino-4-deoxychorismate lyase